MQTNCTTMTEYMYNYNGTMIQREKKKVRNMGQHVVRAHKSKVLYSHLLSR